MPNNLTKPRGKYPHIKKVGHFYYISGTSSRNIDNSIEGARVLDNMDSVELDIKKQTSAVIENIDKILKINNLTLDNLVDVTTFLVNINDFAGYNEVYNKYFRTDGPTRTTVAVDQLPHPHLLIEIKAIAYKE